MTDLFKISEEQIREAVAEKYHLSTNAVCLWHDYEFVKRGADKVRRDFIYGIIDMRGSKPKTNALPTTDVPGRGGLVMKRCTGRNCIMQYGKVDPATCQAVTYCPQATPPESIADKIRCMTAEEMASFFDLLVKFLSELRRTDGREE